MLRRTALAALGLAAARLPAAAAACRTELILLLERVLRADVLDLLVVGEEGWAEHDARLPVLQGAARGLQLAAAAALPLLGGDKERQLPMLTLTALEEGEGLRIRTELVEVPVWRLPLPAGEQLELVKVAGGSYCIGSASGESGRDVYSRFRQKCEGVDVEAQRRVRLGGYWLARHPISQAQWRAVLEAVSEAERCGLQLAPGRQRPEDLWERHGQPGSLPVESVSWHDCQKWLKVLNGWLEPRWRDLGGEGEAPRLALPSESQWEVACRAVEPGASEAPAATPFHFGATLDSSWANFDGSYRYGLGRRGVFRQRLVPNGSFGLVNRWGLAELHGQVWEWCADRWHRDPVAGACEGGSAIEMPDPGLAGNPEQLYQLLRGGSWFYEPHVCRAAYRDSDLPGGHLVNVGFRVCCLPPGLPSWSLNP